MKPITLLFILCLILLRPSGWLCFAQPTKQWDKRFGGTGTDIHYSIQQTSDGGYIIGGNSASEISGDKTEATWNFSNDYWVVKTDASGVKQWDKRFGGINSDWLFSIQQTSDGGYILGGFSLSGISGDKTEASQGLRDYWLVKIDAIGVKQWDKRLGGSGNDYFRAMQQTSDGGYILGGYSYSGISGDKTEASWMGYDYWVVKTDASGAKQWDKRFGGSGDDYFFTLQQTSDGGYIIGGYSNSGISGDKTEAVQGGYDYWVVKTDASGVKQWDKRFGGSATDYLSALQQTSDGGYMLAGCSNSGISGDKTEASQGLYDYWIVKTDASGVKQWDKRFGGSGDDNIDLSSLQQSSDGGYILGGRSNSGISGDKTEASQGLRDYWIVKTDASGVKLWDKRFGGSNDDNLYSLRLTSDGGYILGGYSDSGISGDKSQGSQGGIDFWLAKTTSDISLPIELLSFDAKTIKDDNEKYYVRCNWNTASEINNDYFTIERSTLNSQLLTPNSFEQIGTVKGAGNSFTIQNYSFVDNTLPSTINHQLTIIYYRIRQTDYDGKYTYSDVVPVYLNLQGIDISSISSNLSENKLEYIVSSSEDTKVEIKAIDILGKNVMNQSVSIHKGENKQTLDISYLSAGVYVLQITTESGLNKIHKQFVKN